MRPKAATLLTLLALLCAATAWAANVTIKVTDSRGDPVVSAELDLGFGGPKATTDKDGTATVVVDDDRIDKPAVILVTFFDAAAKRQRTERVTVTLRPSVSLQLPRFDTLPARRFGCLINGGAFQIAPGAGTLARNDAPLTNVTFNTAGLINGNQVFSDAGDLSADDLVDENQDEKKKVRFNAPAHVKVQLPIPVSGSGPCDGSGALLVPSIYAGVGRTNVTFNSINLDSSLNQTFSGSGQTMTFGGEVVLSPPSSPVLFGFGFEHFRTTDVAVERSRPVSDFFDPGARTISDDVVYQARSNSFRFTAGFAAGPVVPYGGVGLSRFQATLKQDSAIDLSPAASTPPPGSTTPPGSSSSTQIEFRQSLRTTFSKTYTHGIAGVAVPLPGPLGLLVESRFTSNSLDAIVRLALIR